MTLLMNFRLSLIILLCICPVGNSAYSNNCDCSNSSMYGDEINIAFDSPNISQNYSVVKTVNNGFAHTIPWIDIELYQSSIKIMFSK